MRRSFGAVLMAAVLGSFGCAEPVPCWYGALDYREGGVVEDPEQLEDFAGSCVVVLGSLTVRGGRIRELDGLEGVIGIHGSLRLKAEALTSTEGLSGLEYVERGVEVSGSASLEHLDFPKLQSIGGDLRLHELPRLYDLTGLEALADVGGMMVLQQLDAIATMTLPEVRAVGGGLVIAGNAQLEAVVEPDALVEIGHTLWITANPRLRSVAGFDALDRVGRFIKISENRRRSPLDTGKYELDPVPAPPPGTVNRIYVENNDRLSSVRGFSGLETLVPLPEIPTVLFVISNNQALTDLDAFSSLETAAAPQAGAPRARVWVYVTENPELRSLSGLPTVYAEAWIASELQIHDNPSLEDASAVSTSSFTTVELYDNPSLTSFEGLRLERLERLTIVNNDALVNLEGVSVRSAHSNGAMLYIADNDALTDIRTLLNAPQRGVLALTALDNRSLPQALASWVALATGAEYTKVAGNAGWVIADPCPFVEDGRCDERGPWPYCVAGTDEVDCAE
ncbi:MAG: hypothetical protein AAF721_19165 [Myxococcota bacterium]